MANKPKKLAGVIIGGRKINKVKNNSMDLDPDVVLSLLASGKRDPQNDQERAWLKSIKETRAKGLDVDLPFN